jgi:DNA-binding transcriptional regulator YiaG
MDSPQPEQVKAARSVAGHSQAQAAETIYKGLRTWQQWESGDRAMDPALYELYLLKTAQKAL